MEKFDFGDLQDLTSYSPVRVLLSGFLRTIFGLFAALIPGVLIWAVLSGDIGSQKPGDLPPWAMLSVGAVLGLVVLAILAGGMGRMVSAFAGGCYFRAGHDGLAVRFPQQGWFGRYTVNVYRFQWSEIEQIVHFTHRINFIPVATALRICPVGGKMIEVERRYFAKSSRQLQKDLLALQADSWK